MHITKNFIASAIAVISIFIISGCQSAMSTSNQNTKEKYTVVPTEWPLRFKKHSFGAYCYDTIGCSVLYNDDYLVKDDEEKKTPPSSSYGTNYREGWDGINLGIENFPGPAIVSWKSKDGASHNAKIDIAEIFKDQRILHNVKAEEIPEGGMVTSPDIILEVNNRTVNVYMKAYIPLKEPRIPGNKYSTHINELMLAYSHTY